METNEVWHPQRITLQDYFSGHLKLKNPDTHDRVYNHLPCEECQPTIDEILAKQVEYDEDGKRQAVFRFVKRVFTLGRSGHRSGKKA